MENTNGMHLPISNTRLNRANNMSQVDGMVVNLSNCPNLKIQVQDEEVTMAENEFSFPTYGGPTAHPEITEGKLGGYDAAYSE